MNNTPNRPDVAAIKARAEAATEGPLFAHENDMIGGWSVMNVNKPPSQANPKNDEYEVAEFTTEADAKFIAHARQDILDLIRYIKALGDGDG